MPRFLPTIALAPLLATLIFTVPADARRPRHRPHRPPHLAPANCSPVGRRVLAADAQAQVYLSISPLGTHEIRGCLYGSRRSTMLGVFPECGASPNNCVGAETFALAGPIVAFGSFSIVKAGSPATESPPAGAPSTEGQRRFFVEVRDLRNGRLLRIAPTGLPDSPLPGLTGIGRALAIVVKSDGALAWIAEDEAAGTPARYEVYGADAAAPAPRLLAIGTGIDPSSLALAGSTVYWSQDGRAAATALR